MTTEIYRDIEGFEGLYQVSNFGNVVSLPKGDGNGHRERTLKVDLSRTYACVSLCKEGKVTRVCNHILVARTFLPNPDNKPVVNHKDLNKLNNFVDNLEWVTFSENAIHALQNGALDVCFAAAKKALADMRLQGQLEYAQTKLTDRFISLEYRGYRTQIHYLCHYCNAPTSERSDGRRLFYKGRCTCCKKHEINDNALNERTV